jgi:hypothetical protein
MDPKARSARLANRVQLPANGHRVYLSGVLGAFGIDVDYARLVKHYAPRQTPQVSIARRMLRHYQADARTTFKGSCLDQLCREAQSNCAPTYEAVCVAYGGHSKKLENHVHMVALYTTWYNFARVNSAVRMSPTTAASLTDRLWDIGDIVKLVEE